MKRTDNVFPMKSEGVFPMKSEGWPCQAQNELVDSVNAVAGKLDAAASELDALRKRSQNLVPATNRSKSGWRLG